MSHEHTSSEIATIASRVLAGGEYTDAEVRRMAASLLTQVRDKPQSGTEVERA